MATKYFWIGEDYDNYKKGLKDLRKELENISKYTKNMTASSKHMSSYDFNGVSLIMQFELNPGLPAINDHACLITGKSFKEVDKLKNKLEKEIDLKFNEERIKIKGQI